MVISLLSNQDLTPMLFPILRSFGLQDAKFVDFKSRYVGDRNHYLIFELVALAVVVNRIAWKIPIVW